MTSFSRGDLKHEATPISECPSLETAVLAAQSPTEFPTASTINPSIAANVCVLKTCVSLMQEKLFHV